MYLEYIYAVQRKWNVRKLNEIGRTISEDSTQEGIDIDEAVKSLESRIVEIGNIGDKQGALSMRQILEDGEDELFGETAMDLGILSGYPDLDAVSCGFKNGEMIVLAGRPSTGKSALITNIMNNLINHDVSALYFSLEMNKRELSCRMLSIRSKVRLDAIMKKRMSNNDKTQVRSAFNELKELPFVIDDEPKRSIEEIRALTRSMITKHRIDILFIDYLQLVTPSDPRDRREEQVSHMSRNIKLMSRELNIPVFVIAQLNRNIESDSKITRLPRLSDLRESGAIEQDADKVIFLSKNTEHPGASEDRWVIDVTVGKNRNGPTGTRQLMFDRSYVKFYSLSKDEGNPF
jgi:replicative DNA helicase